MEVLRDDRNAGFDLNDHTIVHDEIGSVGSYARSPKNDIVRDLSFDLKTRPLEHQRKGIRINSFQEPISNFRENRIECPKNCPGDILMQ